jgi:hypothetical protein
LALASRLLACLKLQFLLVAVDQSQLDRAKASAKYAILANLESKVRTKQQILYI